MDAIENIVETAQVVLSHVYHRSETSQAKKLHSKAIDLAKQQHAKDILLTKQTYLMDVFLNLEQHFQQLNADLISSSKESERDMFDQRNQQFQTIILASSVMFSALSTVIIQGPLNESASSFLLISYSLTTSLSFAFLFLSMILCIEIINRASTFMYKRARKQTEQLQDALDMSKEAMKKLRHDTLIQSSHLQHQQQPSSSQQSQQHQQPQQPVSRTRNRNDRSPNNNDNNNNNNNNTNNSYDNNNNNSNGSNHYNNHSNNNSIYNNETLQAPPPSQPQSPPPSSSPIHQQSQQQQQQDRRTFANEGINVEREWQDHEVQVHEFLKQREEINNKAAMNAFNTQNRALLLPREPIDPATVSFEHFWDSRCKLWGELAIVLFYVGSCAFLVGIMIFMWSSFAMTYASMPGAQIAVILIGCGLIAGVSTVIALRNWYRPIYAHSSRVNSRSSQKTNKKHNAYFGNNNHNNNNSSNTNSNNVNNNRNRTSNRYANNRNNNSNHNNNDTVSTNNTAPPSSRRQRQQQQVATSPVIAVPLYSSSLSSSLGRNNNSNVNIGDSGSRTMVTSIYV